jgi:phosphosulfolactate synthase (CoM biosynthesis protein A)
MEEPLFLRDILELPARSEKPRKVGRTICGISLGRGRESIEQVAQYIDQVKLYVHNTLMPARTIEEAIKNYRAMGIDVQMGGIFFELAAMQGKLDAMMQRAKAIGVNVVEVENHLGAFFAGSREGYGSLKGRDLASSGGWRQVDGG